MGLSQVGRELCKKFLDNIKKYLGFNAKLKQIAFSDYDRIIPVG